MRDRHRLSLLASFLGREREPSNYCMHMCPDLCVCVCICVYLLRPMGPQSMNLESCILSPLHDSGVDYLTMYVCQPSSKAAQAQWNGHLREEPKINVCLSYLIFKIFQAPSPADDIFFEWKIAYHVLLVRVGVCAYCQYQALFSPPPRESGDEATGSLCFGESTISLLL